MSSIKLSPNASGTGEFTIAAPNSNTNRTLTLPDQTGTVLTGSGPISVNASAPAGAVTIDSSGNVGVGVTPSAWSGASFRVLQGPANFVVGSTGDGLTLLDNAYYASGWKYGSNGYASYLNQLNGQFQFFTAPSGTAGNAITFTQAMTLDSSGNLLVGTTTNGAGAKLFVTANLNTYAMSAWNYNAAPLGLNIYYAGAAPNNTGSEFFVANDAVGIKASVRSNGGIANFSGNNVNLSDRREKTNFAPAKSYLKTICAIPVQTFNYIDQNMEEDPGTTLGVVAQDVQAVAPELVMESNWGTKEDPKMRLSIYQTDLQYALMKCIQEQQAIIDAQQTALQTLTARIEALEAK